MDPPWANATVTQLGGFREGEEIWSFKVNGGVHKLCNPQVNILQKSGTFARDHVNFCQQNFEENFDKNINFNAKLY